MWLIPNYPKMELSGLHCDFAALSGFHRQSKHVYFDKAVNSGLLPDRKSVFTDHLAGIAWLVTSAAAELIQCDEWLRYHKVDAGAH